MELKHFKTNFFRSTYFFLFPTFHLSPHTSCVWETKNGDRLTNQYTAMQLYMRPMYGSARVRTVPLQQIDKYDCREVGCKHTHTSQTVTFDLRPRSRCVEAHLCLLCWNFIWNVQCIWRLEIFWLLSFDAMINLVAGKIEYTFSKSKSVLELYFFDNFRQRQLFQIFIYIFVLNKLTKTITFSTAKEIN